MPDFRFLLTCALLVVLLGCTTTTVEDSQPDVSERTDREPIYPRIGEPAVSFEESYEVDTYETDISPENLNDLAEVHTRCEGYRYGSGGFPEDHDRAFAWCTKSAELGDPGGQSILASLYYFGFGVEQNYRDALYWYTLAANRRKPYAALTLFYMYYFGQGVEIDITTAFMYLSRAAELGNEEARELLATPEGELSRPTPSEEQVQALLEKNGVAKFAPVYPLRAQQSGIEGYVIVEYCLDREGRPTNIHVIDSVPERLFDEASIAATKTFRYRPKIVDGIPVERHGVQNKFTFELE